MIVTCTNCKFSLETPAPWRECPKCRSRVYSIGQPPPAARPAPLGAGVVTSIVIAAVLLLGIAAVGVGVGMRMKKAKSLERELDGTNTTLTNTVANAEQLQLELAATETKLDETKTKLSKSEDDVKEVMQRLGKAETLLSETKTEVGRLKRELTEEQTASESEVNKLNKKLSDAEAKLEEQANKLNDQLAAKQKELETAETQKKQLWAAAQPFVNATRYMVIDLTGKEIPRYTDAQPDTKNDKCRTTEMWFRLVLPGSFTIGSPEKEHGRKDNEPSSRQETLAQPFYVGVFEVTQKQYEQVTGANPPSKFKGDTRPVDSVSCNDFRGSGSDVAGTSFLGKLRAMTSLVVDLPTETQWEYACRAGTTTAFNNGKNVNDAKGIAGMGTSYLEDVACYAGSTKNAKNDAGHTKVGQYDSNMWGLFDMHGNVWEWCLGNPGTGRVQRGGSHRSDASDCRSASCRIIAPDVKTDDAGFRVCVLPPPESGK